MKFVFLLLILASNLAYATRDDFNEADLAASILRNNGLGRATNINASTLVLIPVIYFNLDGKTYRCYSNIYQIENIRERIFTVTSSSDRFDLHLCKNIENDAALSFTDTCGLSKDRIYLNSDNNCDSYIFDMNQNTFRCNEDRVKID